VNFSRVWSKGFYRGVANSGEISFYKLEPNIFLLKS